MRFYALVVLAFAWLACLTCAGCSKPAPPTLVPESATVTGVDLQALHFEVRLTATNPNTIDLPVRDCTAKVVVGDKINLGTVTVPAVTTLPAGKATALTVPLAMKWTDLGALLSLAAGAPAIPFAVDGTVNLGGGLLDLAVPFHLAGTLSHDDLANAALRSLPAFAIPGLTRPATPPVTPPSH